MLAEAQRPPADTAIPGGRAAFWLVSGMGLAGAAILFVFEPTTTVWYPLCPFHALTGMLCPGCGATRALHQLLHGNLVAALDHNVLSVAFLPVVGWAWISQGLRTVGRRPLPPLPWNRATLWGLVAVILAFWIGRNLPIYPLTLLAP